MEAGFKSYMLFCDTGWRMFCTVLLHCPLYVFVVVRPKHVAH